MKTKITTTKQTVVEYVQPKNHLIVKGDPDGDGYLIIQLEDDDLLYKLLSFTKTQDFAEIIKRQGPHYKMHVNNQQKSWYACDLHNNRKTTEPFNCCFFYNELIPMFYYDAKKNDVALDQMPFSNVCVFLALYVNIYIDEIVDCLEQENGLVRNAYKSRHKTEKQFAKTSYLEEMSKIEMR